MNKFPEIMGVLNITPDSFSDGGRYINKIDAYNRVDAMVAEGADILDIGGESTRPGSAPVSIADEIARISPVIEYAKKAYPNIKLSIDTMKYEVAVVAVELGADIINDVSGLDFDPRIADLAAKRNCALVLMHMLGEPRTMQNAPVYDNVVNDIYNSLKNKIDLAKSKGVTKIIADFGIGFGKTVEHNIELINNLSEFKKLGVPILLGISRKRFIGSILEIEEPKDRDFATLAIHALCAGGLNNPDIIRVHNVAYAAQLKKLYSLFGNS